MMDSPVRGFPVSEFEARLKRVQKLMAAEDAALLQQAYIAYRAQAHRRVLQQQTLLLEGDALTKEIGDYRRQVGEIWSKLLKPI